LLAIAGSNDELTAPRGVCGRGRTWASVLRLLLNGAERNLAYRARDSHNLGVAPALDDRINSADGYVGTV
jgi:hypothetical protein